MSILQKPVPWLGPRYLERSGIRQLYGKERIAAFRSRSGGVGSNTSYELRALSADGRDITVLKGLQNSEQVLYLEQEIEQYWGIHDEHVRGEIS